MANEFCDTPLSDFVTLDCGTEAGRVVGVAAIKTSYTFLDITDPTEWTSAIASEDVKIIGKTKGSYAGGEVTEIAGFGKQDVNQTGAKHEMVFSVQGIEDNGAFINELNVQRDYRVAFVTSGDLLLEVDVPCNFFGKIVVEEDLDSDAMFTVSVKWSKLANPTVTLAPLGIFPEVD